MAMAEAGDCEPAEEIQVTIAVGLVQIGTAPLHEGQRQAAVDVELVFVRQFDDFSVGHDLSRVEADIWLKKAARIRPQVICRRGVHCAPYVFKLPYASWPLYHVPL